MQHLHRSPEGPHHLWIVHVPPLVRAPVNSFEFHRCRRTPQVGHLMLSLGRATKIGHTAGVHRLQCGLPGYLILFDTRTFEPQRQ